jgi:phosphoribosylformylglycinamidine cyclo-ligase
VLPDGLTAEISAKSWALPPLFQWLQAQGNITHSEMYKTFNCGIGMAIVLDKAQVAQAKKLLEANGETVYEIGHIRTRKSDEAPTIVV